MLPSASFNPRYVDAQLFSQNSATLLLKGGPTGLADFLDSLNYPTRPDKNGTGFYGQCPVCRTQNCFIGTNGKSHLVYWTCLDKTGACESTRESFRTPRNVLSLVKFIVGTQGAAYKTIATYLGYGDRPFDITNGKVGLVDGYTFMVGTEAIKARFDRACLYAALYDGDLDKPELRRKFIVVVMDEGGETLAESLRERGCVVAVHPPSLFNDLGDRQFKRLGEGMLRHIAAGVAS